MPKPLFIICSQGGSEDKASGSLSLFNIVEKIKISKKLHSGMMPMFQFRITSVWMREPEDTADREFEWSVVVCAPITNSELTVGSGVMTFDSPTYRITANILGPMPIDGAGTLRAISRIRVPGATEWNCQEYPVIVEEFTDAEIAQLTAGSVPKQLSK